MSTEVIKLLLVEDNHAYARLFQRILEDNQGGWEVKHALLFSEAKQILSQETFDCVLLDLFLPDSQGMDSITQIRKDVPDLPIIILTALYNPDVKAQALRLGAFDYLLKDQISEEQLREVILRLDKRNPN